MTKKKTAESYQYCFVSILSAFVWSELFLWEKEEFVVELSSERDELLDPASSLRHLAADGFQFGLGAENYSFKLNKIYW